MISREELKGLRSSDVKLLAVLRLLAAHNDTLTLRLRWSVFPRYGIPQQWAPRRVERWLDLGLPFVSHFQRSGKGNSGARQLVVLAPWAADVIQVSSQKILTLPPHFLRVEYALRAHPGGLGVREAFEWYGFREGGFRAAADCYEGAQKEGTKWRAKEKPGG